MKEEFLHYVWEHGLYDQKKLETSDGKKVKVFHSGTINRDAGPDFRDARLRIDNMEWRGNVEIHVRASDWRKHKHHYDSAYNSTILHVCYLDDTQVSRQDQTTVPSIELKGRIPSHIADNYDRLVQNSHWIPCAPSIARLDNAILQRTLDETGHERIQDKVEDLKNVLLQCSGDWENAFYIALAGGFGGNINKLPFTRLAKSVPFKLIRKYQHKLDHIEALLFGTGGYLSHIPKNSTDPYISKLHELYCYLQHLHQLDPMEGHTWKFLRMRPANFPSVRIAQLSAVLHQHGAIFSGIRDQPNKDYISSMFHPQVSPYWKCHYMINGPTLSAVGTLGNNMRNELIINVVVPFLWLYGEEQGAQHFKVFSKELLEAIPAEKNRIIAGFKEQGITPANAFESQALLQLFRKRCNFKACIRCLIGQHIVNK